MSTWFFLESALCEAQFRFQFEALVISGHSQVDTLKVRWLHRVGDAVLPIPLITLAFHASDDKRSMKEQV